MYRVVKPAKTSSAATPVAQSVRKLAVRQQWRREAGPGTIGACHPVLVRHRKKRRGCPPHHPIAGWWWSADVPGPFRHAWLLVLVREGSCASKLCHDPDSYSWFLSTWAFAIVGIWRRRSFCSFPVYLFKFYLFSTWVGFPVFLRFSPRRDFSFRPRGSLYGCWSPRAPLGTLVGAVVRHPLFLVFLEVFVAFLPLFMAFSQSLYFGRFYSISELRGARQVERFAQCSFRHLGQVVFHLAGSLGVFLIFAAPDPGGC